MQAAADKAIKKKVYPTDNPVAVRGPGRAGHRSDQGDGGQPEVRRQQGARTRSPTTSSPTPRTAAAAVSRPGSTFKAFTLITALKEGMKINDGFTAGGRLPGAGVLGVQELQGRERRRSRPTPSPTTRAAPGFKTLQTGTWDSVNTFFMTLEQRVGLCDTVKTAKSLGIKRADGGDAAGVRDVHARHQRDGPGHGGQRLRRHRRPAASTARRWRSPRSPTATARPPRTSPSAARRSTPRSPTRRPTCCRACSPRAR